MDAGNLKEFEEPYRLLRCKGTLLYGLVQQTGHDEAQRLFEMAIKAHCDRHKKAHASGNLGDCQGGCKCKGGVCPPVPVPIPSLEIVISKSVEKSENVGDINVVSSDVVANNVDLELSNDISEEEEKQNINETQETSIDDDTDLTLNSHSDDVDDDVNHADTSNLLPTTEL